MSLPGVAVLRQTPAILAGILVEVDDASANWKPSPDRWSIQEVLGHMAHVEVAAFHDRVASIVRKDCPSLAAYDPDTYAASGIYSRLPYRELLEEFRAARERSLTMLDTLEEGSLARTGRHSVLGIITIDNLMHEWALHDLGHVRQIAELVRARLYYPYLGPWQQVYKMNP